MCSSTNTGDTAPFAGGSLTGGATMLANKELQRLFHELISIGEAQIFLGGSEVIIRVFDNSTKLSIAAPVYFGSDFIPHSVRAAASKTPPFEKNTMIKTSLTIDEERFRIFLQYLGPTEGMNSEKFQHLLEDFGYLAEEWRIYLDEHDKDDLVYVYKR